MSRPELIEAYLSGRLSRRGFIRGLTALGLALPVSTVLADDLRAAPASTRRARVARQSDVYGPGEDVYDDIYDPDDIYGPDDDDIYGPGDDDVYGPGDDDPADEDPGDDDQGDPDEEDPDDDGTGGEGPGDDDTDEDPGAETPDDGTNPGGPGKAGSPGGASNTLVSVTSLPATGSGSGRVRDALTKPFLAAGMLAAAVAVRLRGRDALAEDGREP